MNKRILTWIAVVAIVAIAGWNVSQNRSDNEMSDVALANVEALADGETEYCKNVWNRYYRPEGDGYNCTKNGSETCGCE